MKELVNIFKALSDETRIKILAMLIWEGELCVCDFENVLEITQSKTSRHLRYLLHAGLLEDERRGIWVYYRFNQDMPDYGKEMLNFIAKIINNKEFINLKNKMNAWFKKKGCEHQQSICGNNKLK